MIPAVIEPDVSKWDAWRPESVVGLLERVAAPWYVAAGWAIDLFIGEQRREHEDLEIAVPNSRLDEFLPALAGFEIFVITGPNEATPIELAGEQLEDTHQTWVREPAKGLWRLDVFREPSDGDTWICRRDATVRMPYDRLIEWTDDGIPYGRPEVILLYKAKHVRERDQDFAAALPMLAPPRRRWLAEALEVVHPGHSWLVELNGRPA
ncbi:MAG: nucleotidyltransferase domain-containing protein [Gaiellales bacterium]